MIRMTVSTVAAALALWAAPALAQTRDFPGWLMELRSEARQRGIAESTLDAAFAAVQPIDKVIELDRKQPEFTLTFADYLARTVSPARIEKGRRLMQEHAALLDRIAKRYGVQPRFIVALWGMETDYGRITGGYPVVNALATLAWDGRRSAFFRKELFDALRILDEGHIQPGKMLGSWAGAMGQCQFMPSSFVNFSADGDGDGRRDIWGNLADVFASTANYLANHGWRGDQTWGREVRLPDGFDSALIGQDKTKTLGEWSRLGVKRADGGALPKVALQASLVQPETGKGPAFLVYDNWRAIMKWNRSTFYATAVGHLADQLASR